jgi:hypothetical protein
MEASAEPDEPDAAVAPPGVRQAVKQRDLYVSVNVSPRQFADPGFTGTGLSCWLACCGNCPATPRRSRARRQRRAARTDVRWEP